MLKEMLQERLSAGDSLFPVEKEYAEKHGLLQSGRQPAEKELTISVIDRCLKETEEAAETDARELADSPLSYLKGHMEEFIYIDAPAFETVRMDGLALEVDDVFKTYTALFGLGVQKKWTASIKKFLDRAAGEHPYSAAFSQDGVWDINLPLDGLEGFSESMTIQEAAELTHRTVFQLLAFLEADE